MTDHDRGFACVLVAMFGGIPAAWLSDVTWWAGLTIGLVWLAACVLAALWPLIQQWRGKRLPWAGAEPRTHNYSDHSMGWAWSRRPPPQSLADAEHQAMLMRAAGHPDDGINPAREPWWGPLAEWVSGEYRKVSR